MNMPFIGWRRNPTQEMRAGFTLIEALLAVALLSLALTPILSTAHLLLVAANRDARRALLETQLEERLALEVLQLRAAPGAGERRGSGFLPAAQGGARWHVAIEPRERAGQSELWHLAVGLWDAEYGLRTSATRDVLVPIPKGGAP